MRSSGQRSPNEVFVVAPLPDILRVVKHALSSHVLKLRTMDKNSVSLMPDLISLGAALIMARAKGYSFLQIVLHWLIVVMVVVQLVAAESMTSMVDAADEGTAIPASTAILGNVHYWVGLAILLVMLIRFALRLRYGAPAHAGSHNVVLETLATLTHYGLYMALIAAPISGLLAFYGLADIGDTHALVRPVLFILVTLHVAGALFGQFVRKDGTLTRMLRPVSR